jgi:uncharacterized Tic20 family protein
MNETDSDARTWGMLAHLSAFAGLVLPLVGNVAGPLIVWLVKRDQSAFVAEEAKESLNFNISVSLASLVCAGLFWIAIGVPLAFALFIYWIVMTVLAGIKAGEGVPYRYPLSLRLVK